MEAQKFVVEKRGVINDKEEYTRDEIMDSIYSDLALQAEKKDDDFSGACESTRDGEDEIFVHAKFEEGEAKKEKDMKNLTGNELFELLKKHEQSLTDDAKMIFDEMKDNMDRLDNWDESYFYCETDQSLHVEMDEIYKPNAIDGDYDTTRHTGDVDVVWFLDVVKR